MDQQLNELEGLAFGDDEGLSFDEAIADDLSLLDMASTGDGFDSELEFSVDENEEDVELSDAVLLRTGVDVVQQLGPYSDLVREALLVNKTKLKDADDNSAFVVANSEFPYVPEDVFSTFHKILIDFSLDPSMVKVPVETCAEQAIAELTEATGWSPQLNRPDMIRSFVQWSSKFRKIAETKDTRVVSDVAGMISIKELEDSVDFYTLNTAAFMGVTNFLSDAVTVSTTDLLDAASFGAFVDEYVQSNKLQQFRMSNAYDCVMGYFGSPELAVNLGLSTEEMMGYSTGEVFRRVLLYELNSGIMYPHGLQLRTPPDFQVAYESLLNCMQAGSVAAEIALLLATMMMVVDSKIANGNAKRDPKTMERFLGNLHVFLLAAICEPFKVNPIFYGKVSECDGGFKLSYAIDDQTKAVVSKSTLCDVFGTKNRTYCIPRILFDLDNGCTICPPAQLVTPLRLMQSNVRLKVNGNVNFVFHPTLKWLAANYILVEEEATESVSSEQLALASSEGNPLLTTLLNYDNKFADTHEIVQPVVVAADDTVLYSVSRTGAVDNNEPLKLLAVTDPHGVLLSLDGSMLVDNETGNLIVTYVTNDGRPVDNVYSADGYKEEYLNSEADQEVQSWSVSQFVGESHSTQVQYLEHRLAVKSLCDLMAFDYEYELSEAQIFIARDLYHVLRLYKIEELIAKQLLLTYEKHIEATGGVSNFNVPSVVELLNIEVGKSNALHGVREWSADVGQKFTKLLMGISVSVDSICADLDKLNFKTIALQTLKQGQIQRDVDMKAYKALMYIPEIGSRLSMLEDYIVSLRVISSSGNGVSMVFSRWPALLKSYDAQLTSDNVDIVSNKVRNAVDKGVEDAFPVTRRVLKTEIQPMTSLLEYFILERNLFAVLDTMRSNLSVYGELYRGILSELEMSQDEQVSLDMQAFNKRVNSEAVSAVYQKYYSEFISIVEQGLLNEAVSSNWVRIIKMYDLFNAFYKTLGSRISSDVPKHSDYAQEFLEFVGSFVVSYCPVIDASCGEIDGGATRVMAFVQEPDNFIYQAPIDFLKQYDLVDMHEVACDE